MNAILAVIVAGVAAVYFLIGVALALGCVVEASLLGYRLRWGWVLVALVAWPVGLIAGGKRAQVLESAAAAAERDGGAR